MKEKVAKVAPQTFDGDQEGLQLYDLRFRALLSDEDWDGLPRRVKIRFSKRLSSNRAALYSGDIREMRFSRFGWLLAQVTRIIGGPLPHRAAVDCPAAVCVAEDRQGGGQLWTRVYYRKSADDQQCKALCRANQPGGTYRPGHRYGAACGKAGQGVGIYQRPLFLAARPVAAASAALDNARADRSAAYRPRRWQFRFHLADHPSAIWRAVVSACTLP